MRALRRAATLATVGGEIPDIEYAEIDRVPIPA
jgi:hypothetical protein